MLINVEPGQILNVCPLGNTWWCNLDIQVMSWITVPSWRWQSQVAIPVPFIIFTYTKNTLEESLNQRLIPPALGYLVGVIWINHLLSPK